MSSQHLFEVTDGPSRDDMEGSAKYQRNFRILKITVHNTVTNEVEQVCGWVDAMVPTKPAADRCRWFIRFTVAGNRGDFTSPRYRHFYYDSRRRKGFELPPDHPMCQLEQFLYR